MDDTSTRCLSPPAIADAPAESLDTLDMAGACSGCQGAFSRADVPMG